jgi:tetratricopeptide (TPR) repeat protein
MKRILLIATTLMVLFTALGAADEWIQGAYLDLIAFSADSRFAAFSTRTNVEAVGNAVPDEWIVVADTHNQVIERIQISEFKVIEGESDDRKASAQIEERREKAHSRLKQEGYAFEVEPQPLPNGLLVDYTDKPFGSSGYEFHLKFFIQDEETGVRLDVAECVAEQNEPKPKEKRDVGFFGPGWTVITDESYSTPNGRNFVVFYRTPFMGEYAQGNRGAFIIGGNKLSDFYNSVGFAHYKKKRYDTALEKFKESYFYNPQNPKASYNIACMNALSGDAQAVNEYLDRLKSLKTEEAAALLKQVATDSDFDSVRHLIK